jgi:hypothetical protein
MVPYCLDDFCLETVHSRACDNFHKQVALAPVTPADPGGGKEPGPMRYAGLGVQLAATLLVFVLVGQWLDRKLGAGGIVTVVMVLLGFAGTLYSLIRQLNRKDGGGE